MPAEIKIHVTPCIILLHALVITFISYPKCINSLFYVLSMGSKKKKINAIPVLDIKAIFK